MVDETDDAEKSLECTICSQEITDSEHYIVSNCSAPECEDQYSHQDCIQEYLSTNKYTSQTTAQSRQQVVLQSLSSLYQIDRTVKAIIQSYLQTLQNKAIHAPHALLKAQVCPRTDCTGRVQSTDRVLQTKKKKALQAALHAAVPEPAHKGDVKLRKGPKQAQATKSSGAGAAAQPQAPKSKFAPQFTGRSEVPKAAKASALAHVPQRVKKPERNLSNRFGVLTAINEDEDEEEEGDADQNTKAEQTPSREEVDAAIKMGYLPTNFRTDWCKDFFKSKCSRGKLCSRAHSLEQLQVDAAIEAGKLDQRFKMQFCGDANSGACSLGIRCPNANTAKELRIHALFAEEELDTSYHASLCPEWIKDGRCSEGLACFYAHGREEMRVEAAALLGNVPHYHRFQLCENWYRKGTCRAGDNCDFAHGLDEVRICAAVHYHELAPSYKTMRCQRPRCEFPWKCHYYHSDQDQRKPVVRKTVYCPVFKELGHCEIKNCNWAHGVDDLDTSAFVYDFPQAHTGPENQWAEVAKQKLGKLKTGPSSLNGGNKPAVRTELHPSLAEPMSVWEGKMPAQAEAVKRPGKKKNKNKAEHFIMCARQAEKGVCNYSGCQFAHDEEELQKRREQSEAKRRGTRPPPLNPEKANLSPVALQHLRNLKVQKCTEDLVNMGFKKGASEMAKQCGGELQLAAERLSEGKSGPAKPMNVDVRAEAASVLTMAADVGWTLGRLEEGIISCRGNVDSIFRGHLDDLYDDPSTPGSGVTTPASEYQQSLSDLQARGIPVDDNGFPAYDATLFGSDVHSDRQNGGPVPSSADGQQAEHQDMLDAQAGMFDLEGNLTPEAEARFKEEERRDREARQARQDAYFSSVPKDRSSSKPANQEAKPQRPEQTNGFDHRHHGVPFEAQPAPSRGPAQPRRQPPGFTPDKPTLAANPAGFAQPSSSSQQTAFPQSSGSANGFRQDAHSQQNGFAHSNGDQCYQQQPISSFAANSTANGFGHTQQPQAASQKPQSYANGYAHAQQPTQQSYGSGGFPDSAMNSLLSQPSHGTSGDFSSELWATDARKPSHDWAWIQQQQQQQHQKQQQQLRKSAQRAAAPGPTAQQNFAQQNFAQHQPAQQAAAQQSAAPHSALPRQLAFLQQSATPTHQAPEPVQAYGGHGYADPADIMARQFQGKDQLAPDESNVDDFIASCLHE